MLKYLILMLILCPLQAQGEAIDLERIISIESGGITTANSYRGAKYGRGLCQVSEICLNEYNDLMGHNYNPQDLYEPGINKAVAKWYLTERIPQMLKAYDIPITTDNILIAYNWGIGNLRNYLKSKGELPRETRTYINRYKGR